MFMWAILLIGLGLYQSDTWFGMALFAFGILLLTVHVRKHSDAQLNQQVKNDCPPHKWIYDSTGFLICDQCKQRPGEIPSSYDKPY